MSTVGGAVDFLTGGGDDGGMVGDGERGVVGTAKNGAVGVTGLGLRLWLAARAGDGGGLAMRFMVAEECRRLVGMRRLMALPLRTPRR
jgi:hypothetical protein